jgi:hypothetical protein
MAKPQWAIKQGRRVIEKRKFETAAKVARSKGRAIGQTEGALREQERWTEHLQMNQNNDYYLQRVERPRIIVMDRPKHMTFRAFEASHEYTRAPEKYLFVGYPMAMNLPHGTRVYWIRWEYEGPD